MQYMFDSPCYCVFVLLLLLTLENAEALAGTTKRTPFPPSSPSSFQSRSSTQPSPSSTDATTARPHLIFPGGGIYFYWQAGVVTFLREQGYDLEAANLSGASAGALTASLTATNVDFYRATELALQMAADAGVWDRSGGLQGIWGPLIHDWLDELLPDDAVEWVNTDARLSLLVTPVPQLWGKQRVNYFTDKEDLIRCSLASVHLPFFLDNEPFSSFRGRSYIDGSFLARPQDYHRSEDGIPTTNQPADSLIIDYNDDPVYQSQGLLAFVDAVKPAGIYKMLEDGKRYASRMEESGRFTSLSKKKR